MAKNIVSACTVALVLSLVSGCGTIYNNAFSPTKAYGGVRNDLNSAMSFADIREALKKDPDEILVAAYISLFDLPLSAIGDTLSLPYIFYLHLRMGY